MVLRIGKWCGVFLCLLIAAAWIVSDRVVIVRRAREGRGATYAGVRTGVAVLLLEQRTAVTPRPGVWWAADRVKTRPLAWPLWPEYVSESSGGYRAHSLRVPLWLPLGAAAVPTIWLWRLDRRRPRPTECGACGYDRSGLAPGAACPECGKTSGGAAPARIMPA